METWNWITIAVIIINLIFFINNKNKGNNGSEYLLHIFDLYKKKEYNLAAEEINQFLQKKHLGKPIVKKLLTLLCSCYDFMDNNTKFENSFERLKSYSEEEAYTAKYNYLTNRCEYAEAYALTERILSDTEEIKLRAQCLANKTYLMFLNHNLTDFTESLKKAVDISNGKKKKHYINLLINYAKITYDFTFFEEAFKENKKLCKQIGWIYDSMKSSEKIASNNGVDFKSFNNAILNLYENNTFECYKTYKTPKKDNKNNSVSSFEGMRPYGLTREIIDNNLTFAAQLNLKDLGGNENELLQFFINKSSDSAPQGKLDKTKYFIRYIADYNKVKSDTGADIPICVQENFYRIDKTKKCFNTESTGFKKLFEEKTGVSFQTAEEFYCFNMLFASSRNIIFCPPEQIENSEPLLNIKLLGIDTFFGYIEFCIDKEDFLNRKFDDIECFLERE